jgi:penicillin amidase
LSRFSRRRFRPRRRHRLRRFALGFGTILLAIGLGAGGVGYFWLKSSLPLTHGRIVLAGLDAEVSIARDAHGIPTITAGSERDAAFALGFVHAQDRLYAMDLMRRYGAGRLAEWYGAPAVPIDRFTRTLGLYRAASAQYALLSPALRAVFDAYAAGVNAYLATRRGALPAEYYLVGVTPEPWTPADSLVWGKIMDLQLTGNFRGELLRDRLLQHLSSDDLKVLYPDYPADAPVPSGERAALQGLDLDALVAALPPGSAEPERASNNWVVSGAHSASGKPVLANDTHLGFSAPGPWYLVRIKIPGSDLAGVTAPGAPFIVIGHSARIAWGFTTTGSDVEDLFVETPDPADPTHYLAPGGSLPFETREEHIEVRGGAAETLTIRTTRHGPVISDLAGFDARPGAALALQATWLSGDDRTPEAIWRLAHADNWGEFTAALKDMAAPQQNIVYADADGHIGFIAPARIPIRAKGDGWLSVAGASDDFAWTGSVPFAALPQQLDPPSGRIATANNRIVGKNYPYFLSRDWDLPSRVERIFELLDQHPGLDMDGAAAMQGDDLSPMARSLVPVLLHIDPVDERAKAALALLRQWDFRMDRDAAAPLVFAAWLREINRALFAERLGGSFEDYWSLRPNVVQGILASHQEWCGSGGCDDLLTQSLDHALDDLVSRFGSDMSNWKWGAAHPALFEHPLWSKVPYLRDWLTPRIAADGGIDTVNAGVFLVGNENAPFADRHGPVMRMIVDMAAPDAARFILVPGQSGNPLSPHWDDLLKPWRDLSYVEFGDDASGGTLTLTPP